MRVAYVSSFDPTDVRQWSGLVYFIARAVERQPGVEVVRIGPLRETFGLLYKAKQAVYRYGLGRRHRRDMEPGVLLDWGRQTTRAVAAVNPDVVLAPGFNHVLDLRTDVPIVTYTDATFANIHDVYEAYSNLSASSVRHGARLSQEAIRRFALTCYAAPFAAESAVHDYGADPARVRVIPFGANLEAPPAREEVEAALAARMRRRPVQLLFLGVDWERKGGPLALEVTRALNEGGLPAELVVVGCTPPLEEPLPPYVRSLGFISKATPEGQARLTALLREAHFLLLPTRAESFGVVFCEASAFGVPSLARRVGGVPIWDGENGYAFAPEAGPEPYVSAIHGLMQTETAYRQLALSARTLYEERLSWEVAGAALVAALHDAIALGPPRQV